MIPAATLQHFQNLRFRLLRTLAVMAALMAGLYMVKEELLSLLMAPLMHLPHAPQVIVTGVPQLFFIYLKVCTWGGVFLGLPWLLAEVWRFLSPALYGHEKRVLLPALLAVPILFYGGGLFAFFLITPAALSFFFGFAQPGVVAYPTLGDYLSFLTTMSFAFGLAFNLPVILLLLIKVGLIKVETLRRYRRLAIVLIFVISAVLTPPDPLSQILMALPLLALFEVTLFIASRGKKASL
jgi:sec-independent protein translocase protein TatC